MTSLAVRFAVFLAITILIGIAVLSARPAGHKRRSSAAWRGQIKPPPPPP